MLPNLSRRQALFDIPLVAQMVEIVESRFIDGRPPHFQPAAYRESYDGTTDIFVIDKKDFEKMSTSKIQAIHRHRHILVTGNNTGRPVHFNVEGLQKLADVDSEVYVQRMSLRHSLPRRHYRSSDSCETYQIPTRRLSITARVC